MTVDEFGFDSLDRELLEALGISYDSEGRVDYVGDPYGGLYDGVTINDLREATDGVWEVCNRIDLHWSRWERPRLFEMFHDLLGGASSDEMIERYGDHVVVVEDDDPASARARIPLEGDELAVAVTDGERFGFRFSDGTVNMVWSDPHRSFGDGVLFFVRI